MAPPGMLYVIMQPKDGLSVDIFHDWYNNEHGPLRLRKPDIFTNGLRYIVTDQTPTSFLAVYDVTDMDLLATQAYTALRENRSPREAEVIGQIDVKRHFLELDSVRQAPHFVPSEQLSDAEAEGRVLVTVDVSLSEAEGAEAEVTRWYEEEHIEMLSRVPGWLRTRRYVPSSLDSPGGGSSRKIITLHEYAKENGLGGPEHRASMDTPWRDHVFSKYITAKGRRTYSLFYVFGPAPRELSALSRLPTSDPVAFPGDPTMTVSGPAASITSFVTTSDGLQIPYRLEGNPSPRAPTVAFCNSLLTSLHMWDVFVEILTKQRPELRILRYDTRGRHGIPSPPVPATMDQLAEDLATVLEALRCPRLHALIGVSIGGATALNFALTFPDKLDRFVACDFNVAGSEANTKSWKERIAVAEGQGIRTLAGQTVERWFHPDTMTGKEDVAEWMTDMVAANDVEGFKFSCQALWNYDLTPGLQKCRVPGLLVAGDSDGKGALVKAMEGFKDKVGEQGMELRIVPKAGHLPMCEDPQAFWEEVKGFL